MDFIQFKKEYNFLLFNILFILIAACYLKVECLTSEDCNEFSIFNEKGISLSCQLENKSENQTFLDLSSINKTYTNIIINNQRYPRLDNRILANLITFTLDLSSNEIEFISVESFSHIASVSTLILSSNKINSILNVTNGFSENIHLNKLGIFSSLKSLILNGNKIESIKKKVTTLADLAPNISKTASAAASFEFAKTSIGITYKIATLTSK